MKKSNINNKPKQQRKGKENQLQLTLNKLFEEADPVEILPVKPFQCAESEANLWSVPVMVKYLKQEIELSDYEDVFLRNEINGHSFISMDRERLQGLGMKHFLHLPKFESHVNLLRTEVLRKSSDKRPKHFSKWNELHVASWLTFDKSCDQAAVSVLRTRMTGAEIIELNKLNRLDDLFEAVNSEEASRAVEAIKDMCASIPAKDETKILSKPEAKKSDVPSLVNAPLSVIEEEGNVVSRNNSKKESTVQFENDENEIEDEIIIIPSSSSSSSKPVSANANINTKTKTGAVGILKTTTVTKPEITVIPPSSAVSSSQKNNSALKPETEMNAVRESVVMEPVEVLAKAASVERPSSATSSSRKKPNQKKQTNLEEPKPTEDNSLLELNLSKRMEELELKLREENIRQEKQLTQFLMHERTAHEEKVRSLHEVTEAQSKSVRELRELTQALRCEVQQGLLYSKQQSERQAMESRLLVGEIVKDRNKTLEALSVTTQQYLNSMNQEVGSITAELRVLATTSRASEIGDASLLHQPLPASRGEGLVDKTLESSQAPLQELRDFLGTGGTNVNSTTTKPMAVVAAVTVADEANSVVNMPSTSLPLKSFVLRPPAVESTINPKIKEEERISNVNLIENVDLGSVLTNNGDKIRSLWEELIDRFRLPPSSPTSKSIENIGLKGFVLNDESAHDSFGDDTRVILTNVATRWLRLGNQIVQNASSDVTLEECSKLLNGIVLCSRNLCGETSTSIVTARTSIRPNSSPVKLGQSSSSVNREYSHSARINKHRDTIGSVSAAIENAECDRSSVDVDESVVSAGTVFVLGIMKKILDKFIESDHKGNILNSSNLSYIHEQLVSGSLPTTELSRESIRGLLSNALQINFGNWDKFDAVCQRFDPAKKGFVAFPNVIASFQSLATATISSSSTGQDEKWSGFQAQLAYLLLLTVVAEGIVVTSNDAKRDIQFTMLDVIVANPHLRESFDKLQKFNQAMDMKSSRSLLESKFVADLMSVLFEISKGKFLRVSSNTGGGLFPTINSKYKTNNSSDFDRRDLKLPAFGSTIRKETPPSSGGGATGNRQSDKSTLELPFDENVLSALEVVSNNLTELSGRVARNLQLYDNREDSLISSVSALFVSFGLYRRNCFSEYASYYQQLVANNYKTHLADKDTGKGKFKFVKALESVSDDVVAAGYTEHGRGFQELIEENLSSREHSIRAYLGEEKGLEAMRRGNGHSLEQTSRMAAEIIGLPLPAGGYAGLMQSQLYVDIFLTAILSAASSRNTQINTKSNNSQVNTGSITESLPKQPLFKENDSRNTENYYESTMNEVLNQFDDEGYLDRNNNLPSHQHQRLKSIREEDLLPRESTRQLQLDVASGSPFDDLLDERAGNIEKRSHAHQVGYGSSFRNHNNNNSSSNNNNESFQYQRAQPRSSRGGSLIDSVNETLYQQRINDLTGYLERFTSNYEKQRRRLATLTNLWNASVSLVTASSYGTKQKSLGPVEILLRAREIEQQLYIDSYCPQDTRFNQMKKSVLTASRRLANRELEDPDGTIQKLTEDIELIQEDSAQIIDQSIQLAKKLIAKCKYLAE